MNIKEDQTRENPIVKFSVNISHAVANSKEKAQKEIELYLQEMGLPFTPILNEVVADDLNNYSGQIIILGKNPKATVLIAERVKDLLAQYQSKYISIQTS
jgi:hypothetical protein